MNCRFAFFSVLALLSTGAMAETINEIEPNDTQAQAQKISGGSEVSGRLGDTTDSGTDIEDWYKIDVPSDCDMVISCDFESSLNVDYISVIALNEDGGTYERGFSYLDAVKTLTVTGLSPGTYYIKVRRYSGYGGYTFKCNLEENSYANDVEPNDEYAKAQSIESGRDVQGHLGYRYNNNYIDDEDWFKIDVPSDCDMVISCDFENRFDLDYISVYALNEDGVTYQRGFSYLDEVKTFTVTGLSPGTYYIKVRRYSGYGGYTFKCDFEENSYANDVEPNDEYAKAQSIESGRDVQGHLGYCYDNSYIDHEDWFKIDVPSDCDMVISCDFENRFNLDYISVYALDEDGGTHQRGFSYLDAVKTFTVTGLSPGTYYIRVRRYSGYGGYTINASCKTDPFFSDDKTYTRESPYQLQKNTTYYTTLGYSYVQTREEQWFQFTLDASETSTTVEIAPNDENPLNFGYTEIFRVSEDGELISLQGQYMERNYCAFSITNEGRNTYMVRVPRHDGSARGGFSIRYGTPAGVADGSAIQVIFEGRNTVRKGVPSDYFVVLRNNSDKKTAPFLCTMAATDDIIINKLNLTDINGNYGPDMPYEDVCNSDSSITLLIPYLAPFESYRFKVTAEGKGDILYAPSRYEQTEFAITTALVVCALGYAADVCVDAAGDYFKGKVMEKFELNDQEAREYSRVHGLTMQQYADLKYSGDGYGACVAKKAVETTMKGVMKAVPGGSLAMKVGEKASSLADAISCLRHRLWYYIYKDIGLIKEDGLETLDKKTGVSGSVSSWDPNEMVGPVGEGDEHFIGATKTIDYTILFENKAEAGDAAYRIRVSDELDGNVFDVSSVRFGKTSHDGIGYNWKMTRDGNRLSWDIEGIELPPNKVAPEGEGYVTFSVNLKPGLPDGTVISNKATIIFDKNTPIETNVYSNVLDLTAPQTTMLSAECGKDNTITVMCRSNDRGSGAGLYRLFVSKDGGDYEYCGQYGSPEMEYKVSEPGDASYSFYVRAIDNVGNMETSTPQPVSVATNVSVINDSQSAAPSARYNLFGQEVDENYKGIVIQNGRKVLVR